MVKANHALSNSVQVDMIDKSRTSLYFGRFPHRFMYFRPWAIWIRPRGSYNFNLVFTSLRRIPIYLCAEIVLSMSLWITRSVRQKQVIVGTAICKCITPMWTPLVVSRLCTKAPDIKTTTVRPSFQWAIFEIIASLEYSPSFCAKKEIIAPAYLIFEEIE